MGNKIVFLLTILMLTLFGTAIMISHTTHVEEMLDLDAKLISKRIHQKEEAIDNFFDDSVSLRNLINVERYPSQVLSITEDFHKEHFVFFNLFKDKELIFWSSNLVAYPSDQEFTKATTFVNFGARECIVKRRQLDDKISALAIIPIKRNFETSNDYLNKNFYRSIINRNNVDITVSPANEVSRAIRSIDGTYLFSVTYSSGKYHNIYVTAQLLCWSVGIILLLALISIFCRRLALNNKAWQSVAVLVSSFVMIRFLLFKFDYFSKISSLGVFDPKYYASSEYFPNLWAFFITSVIIWWAIFYMLFIEKYLLSQNRIDTRWKVILISILSISSIYVAGNFLFNHLSTLITNSNQINMDFSNVLGFSSYSWNNLFFYCLNLTLLVKYAMLVINQIKRMTDNLTLTINVQLLVLVCFLFLGALYYRDTMYYNIILGGIILTISYSKIRFSDYKFFYIVIALFCTAILATMIYQRSFQSVKDSGMKLSLNYLESENDYRATTLFTEIEPTIHSDSVLINMLANEGSRRQPENVSTYLKDNYFNGYLSKYDPQYYFYTDGEAWEPYSGDKITEYREKVINNSVRVPLTNGFYKVNSDFGAFEYFGLMDFNIQHDNKHVQIFVNLKHKAYNFDKINPAILADHKSDLASEHFYEGISFALYREHKLVAQNGNYLYPNTDYEYPQQVNRYINLPRDKGFVHLMVRPDTYTTIVVSQPAYKFWEILAIVSYFFISLLFVFYTVRAFRFIINLVFVKAFTFRALQFQILLLKNRLRYSTRIRTMVILTVLITVFSSGFFAFFTIRRVLASNSVAIAERNIAEIVSKVESSMDYLNAGILNENTINKLNEIKELNSLDLNIYSGDGKIIYTSQPRIYDNDLVSGYINPIAYNELNVVKKNHVSLNERIGDFEFTSTYSTIRDNNNKAIAFINIPDYSSKGEEIKNSNQLLGALINIYTVIILASGIFSVLVSRQITRPLAIIRRKIAETNVKDQSREPIYWENDDEIGALIKEYNLVLHKMEESTKQLMNAERAYAWREMAKQIAHEIKNPLTPMKLGIQQLMRTYNENDPRFPERFNKFSASFIEQINSLSKIATEFSNFAQMPEAKMVKINIFEIVNKVANLYYSTHNTTINVKNMTDNDEVFILGDKDQLLRSFNNLIKNAIEASRGRKKHLVSILLDYAEEGKFKIIVKDNGMGIPLEVIPKIFQPNFTTKSSGTGLGLAFVKKTIESMKGDITFVTMENIGTTFTIILPLYDMGSSENS